MKINYTQHLTKGKYEVHVDPVALYGWFEHETLGDESGGGLWFGLENGVTSLMDYDGVFQLPKPVVDALRELGYYVNPEYFE